MIKTVKLLAIFTLLSNFCIAQNSVFFESEKNSEIKLSFLDSIKKTFIADDTSKCMDSLWMQELVMNDTYNDLAFDIKNINLDQSVSYELPTELLKERLRIMDEKSPFNIEYNVGLENIIKSFLKNRKKAFERLMGVSQFYFPMFEEAMAKYNVPLEIKYLAIVESALNPNAVSRMGATGLWQFMYQTGKQYKLNINSYVDERSDPIKASDAAGRYMQGMYKIFGDWELVLASYNSGAGNVSKAIRRSGGYQNFWNIKKFLPRETQSYVPAFLATMYIFEYHKEHGIVPNKAIVNHLKTDTIAVKKKMSFTQISNLLDIPVTELEFLNPSYKMKVIPFVTNETHFLRLPVDKIAVFASNENKIYSYINHLENNREKPFVAKIKQVVKDSTAIVSIENKSIEEITTIKTMLKNKFYKVKRGDNLSDIAKKFDVSMSDIKSWNNLRSNRVQAGTKLKIKVENNVTVVKKTEKIKTETHFPAETKTEVVKETVVESKEYVVKSGDNLTQIAKDHKLYVADLKKWNNLKSNQVKPGDVLKLTASENNVIEKETVSKTIYYTVKKGDNITKIAQINNVELADIKQWNNLQNNNVQVGVKLKIEKQAGKLTQYSKKENNNKTDFDKFKMYEVQKGDSLYSISLKHHTTVAVIKMQNDIKDENLQPGMKLKIKG